MSAPRLLDADQSVLLVVDMQARLAAAMETQVWEAARDAAILLVRAATELRLPILVTRQYPQGLGDTDETLAAALPPAAEVVDKTCFSAADDLHEALAMTGRSQMLVCGMEAHVCVLQTVAGLAALGLEPFVADDAVCSRDPGHARNALARMQAAGITLTNSESAIFEWLRDARHTRFKKVTKLLR